MKPHATGVLEAAEFIGYCIGGVSGDFLGIFLSDKLEMPIEWVKRKYRELV